MLQRSQGASPNALVPVEEEPRWFVLANRSEVTGFRSCPLSPDRPDAMYPAVMPVC